MANIASTPSNSLRLACEADSGRRMAQSACSDGRRFLYIRECQERGDEQGESALLAELSGQKPKSWRQLMSNEWLLELFDSLRPYDGLWDAFSLGWIPAILSWKMKEVRLVSRSTFFGR